MAIDMSQFFQVFFEEAEEHLASMEQLLLDSDPQALDEEQMNAIFRAAHSIKGSAGTFGFQDVAQVTHELETLLDLVRKGELALTVPMVDAALAAGDQLKGLLAAHRGEGQADAGAVAHMCERLRQLSRRPEALPVAPSEADLWLEFVPDARTLAIPVALDNMLAELGRLGELQVELRGGPDGAGPWRIRMRGAVAEHALREVLEFVAEAGTIHIATASPDDADDGAYGFFSEPPPAPAAASEDEAFGLFEPLPVPVADEIDPGYGFFAPLPEDVVPPAAETCAPPPVPAPADKPVGTARKSANDAGSIRVGVQKVDQMINLVGELVITQAMIAQAAARLDPALHERLMNGIEQLARNTRDMQESVMSIRMMPISMVFSRFPRVVRDVSGRLGKQVRLVMSGEATELDKGLIERIADPLTHLIRNSLDHGIEAPDVRLARGKSAEGTITLRAHHQSGNIVIEVGDDGAGLNRERILAKARERGLAAHDGLSDQEVWQLIFEPGFSTAEQVTEVSGRGVGMDVVKKNIGALGGRVDIESVAGVGTRMTVRLPLTLAILDGMSVTVGDETYIIPLSYVVESLQPERAMIKSVSGVERLIQVRGEYLPLIVLDEYFGRPGAPDFARGIMVVLEADGAKAALLVDALNGQHQVVIKSLEANYRRVAGLAGATIMGDGRVAMILDVSALVGPSRPRTQAAA